MSTVVDTSDLRVNPFKPVFTIIISIHYCRNSRLVVNKNDLMWHEN